VRRQACVSRGDIGRQLLGEGFSNRQVFFSNPVECPCCGAEAQLQEVLVPLEAMAS
jgi:hypothetical protein